MNAQDGSPRDNTRLLYGAIAVLLLTTGLLAGLLLGGTRTAPVAAIQQRPAAAARPAVNLPAELVQFLAGWKCPCGCGDRLLDCSCAEANGAREVQDYVKSLYDERIPLDDIRTRVVERYGASVVGGLR